MPKVGFMFGAGAEFCYGLPSGGDFALNIFRQDASPSKSKFRAQRDAVDLNGTYAQWLPDDLKKRNISAFGKKAYEDIIRSTVEQNREGIIARLNTLDQISRDIVSSMKNKNIDIDADFAQVNERTVTNSFMNRSITFIPEFEDGNDLFKSNYFSALIMSYKRMRKNHSPHAPELGKIILAILQLQVGALGEKLTHRLNEGVFKDKDEELDILDDLGDIIQLDYKSVGMAGLEYLLELQKPESDTPEGRILQFAQYLIEKIYSCVLDYKSLIDSNWMYLYHPVSEWGKFCKISIFLLNVQKYINEIFEHLPEGRTGYYDDLNCAVGEGKLSITTIGTSNYTPLIQNKLKTNDIIYLNGATNLWYDPYLNRIGTEAELSVFKHFIVPLMFTQSGTKPMISIDMSSRYVDFYNRLGESDEICVIGFGFNSDDEHINGIFRDLIDRKEKSVTIISRQGSRDPVSEKEVLAKRLKLQDSSRLSVILVDDNRMRNGKSWVDCLVKSIEAR